MSDAAFSQDQLLAQARIVDKRLKVCVLQPDYGRSAVDYKNYDPARNLAGLLPDMQVDNLFLRKELVYKQLRDSMAGQYDIYVNLCQGYLEWDVPSIDVIWNLDLLSLPYTGPSARLYDPSKPLMKYVAHVQGVHFPRFLEVRALADCEQSLALGFPLFVKPAHAGDSLGIDAASHVTTAEALRAKCAELLKSFSSILVEQYVAGREFTVLVAANPSCPAEPLVLRPLEFVFSEGERFKTYELKLQQYHPECNVPVLDAQLDARLRSAAQRIFSGFSGEGYARLDFRMDADGVLHFLDINFACCIFYPPGHEGSADYILAHDPLGPSGFLRHIIAEGMLRYERRRKKYERRPSMGTGFGIFATMPIRKCDIIFRLEGQAQRIVTRRHVEQQWSAAEQHEFYRCAYPISEEVYLLWDENPEGWAPQNHSCDPNTCFAGLDVVARRDIAVGEELTFDHAELYDERVLPFDCLCGAPNCRGRVAGTPGNSITLREKRRNQTPQV